MLDNSYIFDGTLPNTGAALTVTRDSTNVLDLLVSRDIGAGAGSYDQEVHVMVTTAFTAGGAATLNISLKGSLDNATYYDLLDSPQYALADLVVGARIFRYEVPVIQLKMPVGDDPPRYLKLVYTVGTGPFTAGALFSYLAPERQEYLTYPRNYSIGSNP